MSTNSPFIFGVVSIVFVGTFFPLSVSSKIAFPATTSPIGIMNDTQTNCAELVRQYLILADLQIIQAVKYIMENNITGVSDQLSTADEMLDKVVEVTQCP